MASLLSSLLLSLFLGYIFLKKTNNIFNSKVRAWVPDSHQIKNNIPKMGGIFIISSIIFNCLLWCKLTKPEIWIFLVCLIGFGIIGGIDDWLKIKHDQGMTAKTKFLLQWSVALLVIVAWLYLKNPSTTIYFPFFKNLNINLSWVFAPWAMFVIVATSNAVNLTDGLDGLAIGSLISNFTTFSIICYLAGHKALSAYLHIPFAGTAELSVIGAILIGTSLGFLWFNAYPAEIFMGDIGALSLGAVLGLIAIISKEEFLLIISGGLFVFETLSVIIQIFTLKTFNRKVFKMTPIHHHFEMIGWPESKITIRFGIISLVLSLLALMTLKLR
jgi:phospho-N-acetylmuramoyl-pentapeptide-transferase